MLTPRKKFFVRLRVDSLLLLLALMVSLLLYARYNAGAMAGVSAPAEAAPVAAEPGTPEQEPPTPEHKPAKDAAPVRFLMYNVHDYFVDKDPKRSRHPRKTKPIAQREGVAGVIAGARPEVVGLIEIGGPAALDDLAARLEARGLRYPYRKTLTRWGEDRALALLSMHPIVADHSVADCKLVGQSSRRMLRGILDVSIQPVGDERVFRIIGAHLKSKVADDPREAEMLRIREARTLAAHISAVLLRSPQAALLIYGDWNDGPGTPALNTLTGCCGGQLRRLNPVDDNGETWTIYYRGGQEYSVFDQIYVSPSLSKSMGRKSRQAVLPQPGTAPSDHRALWCEMR